MPRSRTSSSGSRSRCDPGQVYRDPVLRERLKRSIMAGERGGRPGQWSARKAQMLAQEYVRHGGQYCHPRSRSIQQRHLMRWTREKWRTATGAPALKRDGRMDRYLPDRAWRSLSPSQARATRAKKLRSRSRQFVPNTARARLARR
jgi:hypothetical protein